MNSLTPTGAAVLAAALPALPRLAELDLGTNAALGLDGARVLAPALRALPHLRDLSLGFCALGDGGVAAVAAALPAGLVRLAAPGNGVTPDGARAVAAALHAQRLARAPVRPRPLAQLILSFNAVRGEDEPALLALFEEALPGLRVSL